MTRFEIKCPKCNSDKLWDRSLYMLSDKSVEVEFECQVCRHCFDVGYLAKGYASD